MKNKPEASEILVEMSQNNNYRTGNLLNYLYHQNYYKCTGIDLSKQKNTIIPQQISFVWKLEDYDGATMFLSLKSS